MSDVTESGEPAATQPVDGFAEGSAERSAERFAESEALHARARAFVEAFEAGGATPEPFDALARDIARFQAAQNPAYARLCRARGTDPTTIARAADAPAVPTDAFKLARVATFPETAEAARFRTSGTTVGPSSRGVHAMRTTATYDAGALAFGRAALAPETRTGGTTSGDGKRMTVVALAPSPMEAADSSLVHMMDTFIRAFGTPAPYAETYFLSSDVLDVVGFDDRIARELTRGSGPVLVLGTSFAFVHLLDAVGEATFGLPEGSRVMQTGGFKGKSREVSGPELRRDLARAFGIPERAIVSEYGMTELSSQFYEATLVDAAMPHGIYVEPPWARVVPVDPESLAPVEDGAMGIARIEDLLNVDSAFAVLAADRVRRIVTPSGRAGFELLGRAAGAPPRGCSIAIDELLGR